MSIPRCARASVAILALFAGLFAGSAALSAPASTPPLLLISLDGFRWDYCALHPAETPNLHQLMHAGVSARGLIPVFPSNTFPNHYSIVTGLYPSHHGIINNDMFDPALGEFFHYNVPLVARRSEWWGGEPIWVTAILQGRRSATSFWIGSEAEIKGLRPTYWKTYDYSVPFANRLDELSGWLQLPAGQRPAFVAFYLEETNSVGHMYGPDSPEITAAIKLLDGHIGAIMSRLRDDHLDVNVIVVSDHGLAPASADHVPVLDD